MYRAPADSKRCPSCGGAALSHETKLDPSEGWLKVHFGVQPAAARAGAVEAFIVGRARVCLDCGHVIVGLSPVELARLRQNLPALVPIA